jgi:hypothetical protein
MTNDDEDLPVSFLVYVIAALVVIAAIAIGGFILFLR